LANDVAQQPDHDDDAGKREQRTHDREHAGPGEERAPQSDRNRHRTAQQ
jgi:hypothetical protein